MCQKTVHWLQQKILYSKKVFYSIIMSFQNIKIKTGTIRKIKETNDSNKNGLNVYMKYILLI